MGKKFLAGLTIGLFFFGIAREGNATLIDLGAGAIQDDRNTGSDSDDYYWIKDLNRFVGMTYDEQKKAISGLDNQGVATITGFHMAYSYEINTLLVNGFDELTNIFTPTRVEDTFFGFKGRYDQQPPNSQSIHYELLMNKYLDGRTPGSDGGSVGVADSATFPGAFAVAYVLPPSPVPEPTTMLLFGAGIAGLAAVGRRKKN